MRANDKISPSILSFLRHAQLSQSLQHSFPSLIYFWSETDVGKEGSNCSLPPFVFSSTEVDKEIDCSALLSSFPLLKLPPPRVDVPSKSSGRKGKT